MSKLQQWFEKLEKSIVSASGVARGLGQGEKNLAEEGPLANVWGPRAKSQKKS